MKSKIQTSGLTKHQYRAIREKIGGAGAALALDVESGEIFVCEPSVRRPSNLNHEYYKYLGWLP